MQIKPTTGPYLLMAGGAAVLVLALISLRLPIFAAAAVLFGLGFWSLRSFKARWLSGPYLLWAGAVALLVAGYSSATAFLIFVSAAFAGLGAYAWMHEQDRR